jgi:spore germination protein
VRSASLHVIGFAVNSSHRSFAVASTRPHLLSEVAPFWYGVTAGGTLKAKVSPATLAWARRHHIALMPLFNNAGGQYAVLVNPASRNRAVSAIADAVKIHGYAGASIDFQGLPDTAPVRTGFDRFLTALSRRLHGMHRTLTVNVIPTRQATAAHGAYDEAMLARSADQVILMAYDRHAAGSPPGPVAPLQWVRQGVRHALAMGLKPSQIYLGVASYGYDWKKGSTQATTVGYRQVVAMGVKPIWDPAAAEYHFTYTKNGVTHVVWYEGPRSLVQRVQLAKNHSLYGIAIWRLGYETPSYWSTLGAAIGGKAARAGTAAVGRPKPRPGAPLRLRSLNRMGPPHAGYGGARLPAPGSAPMRGRMPGRPL